MPNTTEMDAIIPIFCQEKFLSSCADDCAVLSGLLHYSLKVACTLHYFFYQRKALQIAHNLHKPTTLSTGMESYLKTTMVEESRQLHPAW